MAYHVRDMNQLDRMIFEDCLEVDGAVVAPHINIKSSCPFHLRPEILQKKIGCDFRQAAILADAWSIIEATPKMVDAFISLIKTKGIEQSIPYFEHLAMKLAEVEPSWDHEAFGQVQDDAGDIPDDTDEEYREEIPDMYAYHVIGYDKLSEAMDLTWEERQSRSYKALLNNVRGMTDLDALRDLGKKVYAMNLSRDQAGVFWYEYGKSQARIMDDIRQRLGATARGLLKQITNANGNLAALGAKLYKIQNGAVKIANPPAKHEWIIIWEAYHDQQASARP
ncbi:MAG: hypothetical protein V1791_03500 [Pseudomonadota bacterium]